MNRSRWIVWTSLVGLLQGPGMARADEARVRVAVRPQTESQCAALPSLPVDWISEIPPQRPGRAYEAYVDEAGLSSLLALGVPVDPLPQDTTRWRDQYYWSYEEVLTALASWATLYPELVHIESLGVSTRDSVPVWAVKISDNAPLQEDEPDVLFDSITHAREPINTNIVMALGQHLLDNYGTDPQVTAWVDSTEIWILPIKNPEGYLYVETGIPDPWWRKDKRDNNGNGLFDGTIFVPCGPWSYSMVDGVDLNRNYDFDWSHAGDALSCSIVYRGPSAFSENETRLERDFARRERPILGICYHSYSEYVGYTGQDPAGQEICQEMASRILRENGSTPYDCDFFTGSGMSYAWLYWHLGMQAYLIETATEFFPQGVGRVADIVEANLPGALYLLERLHGAAIRGHVVDALTGRPLEATVEIVGEPALLEPRTTEPVYGRYWRLVEPGPYQVRASAPGYRERVISPVIAPPGRPVTVDIRLIRGRIVRVEPEGPVLEPASPNPFTPSVTIPFTLPASAAEEEVRLEIYGLRGERVRTLVAADLPPGRHVAHWDGRDDAGRRVSGGVYLVRLLAGGEVRVGRLVLLK